jgi:hypothetical protein
MRDTLIDYNEISFESLTLKMEIAGLNDDVLLDECNFILSGKYYSKMMDEVLVSYFKNGKISKEERKKAEALYILANGDLAWEI